MLSPPRAAYLHIPFCLRRCFYCDFAVVPLGDRADGSRSPGIPRYLEILQREIRLSPAGPPLSTVYLGGGTPSLLTPEQVGELLRALRQRYGLAPGAEITMEMDPATFDEARLGAVLRSGVNRVSLGGQSFDDAVLQGLGRHHRRQHLLEAAAWLDRARRRGDLRSWSLDLIQGVPSLPGVACGSSLEALPYWRQQLAQAIRLQPPHLSVYDLTIEPGTVLAKRLDRGTLELPDHDVAADVMDLTASALRAAGYGRYEISNYALPGHASRHNRVYWSGAGWWGFGMGATAAPEGQRVAKPRTREGYGRWLNEGGPLARAAEPPRSFPLDERLMVGLRRREGVPMVQWLAEDGLGLEALEGLRARLSPWLEGGWLRIEGQRWRLSDPEGLALSNSVLRDVLDWCGSLGRAAGESIPATPPPTGPDR
ncbi:MAG: coproporphyrinogen-III oxidase family protein [Cyanobacteriota bacterium]|nr:coproporphyrinogen-III oxidase family protein [Cyanobacteriota bacterium]